MFLIKPNCFGEFLAIIQFLLSEFSLENFTLTSVDKDVEIFHVYIEEKNAADINSEKKNLLFKGYFTAITI